MDDFYSSLTDTVRYGLLGIVRSENFIGDEVIIWRSWISHPFMNPLYAGSYVSVKEEEVGILQKGMTELF